MKQQSNVELRGTQIVVQLPQRPRREDLSRFRLQDELFVNNEVQALTIQRLASVPDDRGYFSLYLVSPSHKLSLQRLSVHTLQKSETKFVIDIEERTND